MKDYKQMAEDALRRIEEHKEIQQRKNKVIKLALIPAACLCLVIALGIRQKITSSETLIVNEPDSMSSADMDAKVTDYIGLSGSQWESVLAEFHDFTGFSYEEFTAQMPDTWEISRFYSMSAPHPDDTDSKKYYLHDYGITWETPKGGEVRIRLSPLETPLKDCIFICTNPKPSEINGISLVIHGYTNSSNSYYSTIFACKDMYYDIEAINLSLAEFQELLLTLTN